MGVDPRVLIAGGAFVAYVVSRIVGLPGLPDDDREWGEPIGILSLVVEALFVALAARELGRRAPAE